MKYVTARMIAEHAGKHHETVLRALKATKTPTEKFVGVKGLRVLRKEADRFLAMQWPEVGPLPNPTFEEASR